MALAAGVAALLIGCAVQRPAAPAADAPPPIPREFRGAWVATVGNIDWPSRRGLSSDEQRAELTAILDRAVELNLNTVVLQVRTTCDALYASDLEPWSLYLTGEQGASPGYDPLAFAVQEAHRRGLQLHAWFNPYRAGYLAQQDAYTDHHISRTRPDLVRAYGKHLWLDPGEPDVQMHVLNVILDVVRRYDIDGVHLDDYFYPYPVKGQNGAILDFPDGAPWQAYLERGGKRSRPDWRRDNVNRFVQQLYTAIKSEKPHVLMGISPFGIWQPGHPPQVKGMNQHQAIYADAKLWLNEGWCDYFSPQLYWNIRDPDQSFIALLAWWQAQNHHGRHLWPGLNTSRTRSGRAGEFDEQEIGYQIEWARIQLPDDPGHIHFSMKPLMRNTAGLSDALQKTTYREPALPPASPWLSPRPPATPDARLVRNHDGDPAISLASPPPAGVQWYVVQAREEHRWVSRIVPAAGQVQLLPLPPHQGPIRRIALTAIDRTGNASWPLMLPPPRDALADRRQD